SSDAPADAGDLAGLAALLSIDAGSGSSTLNVSEKGTPTGDTVTLTSARITGTTTPFTINYQATGGTFGGGVHLTTGSGNDTVNVQSALTGGVVTKILTNGGDDTTNVSEKPESAYALFVDGGPGTDTLRVTDIAGGAVEHNHNFGSDLGTVEGIYLSG